jgi:formate dehydrogenase major subunit/formate dehydrogenase alpha subunit
MTNSIRDIAENSKVIFIIGSNTTEQHPVIGIKIRRAKRMRGAKLIVADPRRIDIARYADLHIRHKPGTDIALLNGIMHILLRDGWQDDAFIASRTEGIDALKETVAKYTPERASEITGVPVEQIELAAKMLGENRPGSLLYAMGITQHIVGVQNVVSCANLQMLLGNMGVPGGGVNPLRGQNNVQGACDMGGLPNYYPGYQHVTDATNCEKFEKAWGVPGTGKVGLTVTEMLKGVESGQVRCLYVIGENPMTSDPDLNHVKHALRQTEFMVLQEIFPSETAQYADVVLPAASWAEKEGTFTNTERRIQRVRKAVPAPGEAMLDSRIVIELAKRMIALAAAAGAPVPDPDAPWADWEYQRPQDVMAEANALTPIYAGVTYERLDAGAQLQWPVRGKDHPGTPVLHVGQFSRGLGRFIAAEHVEPAELPDDDYPLMLTTGRVIYHWHGAEMTRRASGLNTVYPEALIEVSPKDAQRAGVRDGDLIRLESRRGEIVAKAQVTTRVGAGLVFATFHFPESAVNFLTNPVLDPTAKIPEFKVCAVKMSKEPA